MSESRHQRLERLFLTALDLPLPERAAFVTREVAGDDAMRAEIEDLLAREASTPSLAPVVPAAPRIAPPATIGPYALGEKLGEGGFGEVYAARQSAPIRREVAIKLLRAGLDSQAVLARFEAERQALAQMSHPGIARVHDAGRADDGRSWFAMERVDGVPLTDFCERNRSPLRVRLELVVAIARAVEHAHQKGILHRDLKPSNLLVTVVDGRPSPKVIDFGIAKALREPLAEGSPATLRGEFVGTPEYVSPEQAESGGVDVDTRSDVYSLGVVLYRLLTGRLPIESESLRRSGVAAMARVLREAEPVRPSAAVRGAAAPATARELAGDLDWITLKALERDRERRYPSAAALADDLERHLRNEPVEAGPPTAAYRLGKLVRRHRAAFAGAAAVVLALVAGLAATLWQAQRARREAAVAGAVSEYLASMIGGANPEQNPGGRDVTVRAMVDRAVAGLDGGAAGDPEVEAGVRHAIGATYMGLGEYDAAATQLDRAIALRALLGGRATARRIESRLARVELEERRGRYALAGLMLDRFGRIEPAVSRSPAAWNRFLQLRAGTLGNLGRTEEADSAYVLAARHARANPGVGASALAVTLGDLAEIRSRRGMARDADSLAREALAIARRAHPGGHHEVANAATRLGAIAQAAGEVARAESLHREAFAIDRAALGARHPTVAIRLSNLASLLVERGALAEAESLHREAVALLTGTLGEGHPTTTIARGQLATLLQATGRLDETLAIRQAVLAATREQLGEEHEEVANALNNLAACYRLLGRRAEAISAFRDAIARFRRLYGDAHPTVVVATHNLGKTLLEAGRTAEAEATVGGAVEMARRLFPAGHLNLAIFESTHGRCLLATGRAAAAERTLLAAHAVISATLGAEHPRTREVAVDLATAYERLGRAAEARKWREAAGAR
jgi:tetratricopeptide (TPR) repeat protein